MWFVKAVWTKFTLAFLWDLIPYPAVSPRFVAFHPKRIAEFAAGNPVEWYKNFLEGTILPNSKVFATLQTFGEAAVGLGLILGLVTGLTALVGLFQALSAELIQAGSVRAEALADRLDCVRNDVAPDSHGEAARALLEHITDWLRAIEPAPRLPHAQHWTAPPIFVPVPQPAPVEEE